MKKIKLEIRGLSPRIKQLILNEFYLLNFGEFFFEFILKNKEYFNTSNNSYYQTPCSFSRVWKQIKKLYDLNVSFNVKTFYGYFFNDRSRSTYNLFRSVQIKDEIPKAFNDVVKLFPCIHNGTRLDLDQSIIFTVPLHFYIFPSYLYWLRVFYSTTDLFEMLPGNIQTVENVIVHNYVLPIEESLISQRWLNMDFKKITISRFKMTFEFFENLFKKGKKNVSKNVICCGCIMNVCGKYQMEYITKKFQIKTFKITKIFIKNIKIGNIKFKGFLINNTVIV